jgi:DNA-binding NtrC family response regulator
MRTDNPVILIVDDEPAVCHLLQRILGNAEYATVAVQCASEATRLVEDRNVRIDLVLADINMPGTNGLDLHAAILRERPQLPVVFVTGVPENSVVRAAMDEKLLFLQKPLTGAELLKHVRSALDSPR